eukprot:464664-Rhodomonas_salina.1
MAAAYRRTDPSTATLGHRRRRRSSSCSDAGVDGPGCRRRSLCRFGRMTVNGCVWGGLRTWGCGVLPD